MKLKSSNNLIYLLFGLIIGVLFSFLLSNSTNLGKSVFVLSDKMTTYQKCVEMDVSRYFIENKIPENYLWYRESTDGKCVPGKINVYDPEIYSLNFYNIKEKKRDGTVYAEGITLTNKTTHEIIRAIKDCTYATIGGTKYHISVYKDKESGDITYKFNEKK